MPSVDRELAEDPAAGLVVIQHDRVAVVVGLAESAEAGPERIAGEGTVDQVAGDVEDAPDGIDVLNVDAVTAKVQANIAVHIRRYDREAKGVLVILCR